MTKKPVLATVLTALAAVTLLILSFCFSKPALGPLARRIFDLLTVVCVVSALYCFIAGELTKNYSQMDKLWSLLPIAYCWIIAFEGGLSARPVIFALIVSAWGIRLTVNFARKGAYRLRFWQGNEDYRWKIVKSSPAFRLPLAWTAFDLCFISVYQNFLVLAICLPALACVGSDAPLSLWDMAAGVCALGFLTLETVADEYQWKFHETKKRLQEGGRALEELPVPYDLGFNTTGPWARMRHPNYLGEMGMWLSLYFFAVGAGAASRGIFHWTLAGPLLLVLLFMGSSALGEKISSSKYPLYGEYVKQVYKYLPLKRFSRGDGK